MLQGMCLMNGQSVWVNNRALKCSFYSQLMKGVRKSNTHSVIQKVQNAYLIISLIIYTLVNWFIVET